MDLSGKAREKDASLCDRSYQKLPSIYKDHVTNEDVSSKIQAATGKYDKLLILVKKQKLRMDDLRFYVLFNSISVISGQCLDDNERMCAMELRLQLRRFHFE